MPINRPTKKELLDKLAFQIHVMEGRLEEEPSLPLEILDVMVSIKGNLLRLQRLGAEYKLWTQ